LKFLRKSVDKFQDPLKSDKSDGALHEYQCTYFIISRSSLLRMRDISNKSCREDQNTHFVSNNYFFYKILPSMR